MSTEPRSLHDGFLRAAERFPDRPALEVAGKTLSYAELRTRVTSIAATLQQHRSSEGSALTAVLAHRSASGYAGILGALCSGHGYVPMVPTYPAERLANMIDRCESRTLIIDGSAQRVLGDVLTQVAQPLTVLVLDRDIDPAVVEAHSRHTFLAESDLTGDGAWTAPACDPNAIAYLLFTSGSTGQPKGVMVGHRNITRFLDFVVDRYELSCEDRFSHMFEVTFDLSLFDIFASLEVGGCLCVPNMQQRLLPARFVTESKLTVWFSVPSTALLMKETRTLEADAFGGLRISLFCGEALPVPVAQAWCDAAPNSVVENIYGPTELTLACTHYRCADKTAEDAFNDVVAIGDPFDQMRAKVVDADLNDVPDGDPGELIMAGPQVTLGYYGDPERTAKAFVVPPGETETFYRTGDRVVQPKEGGAMVFVGRLDHQIKVRGFRVELGDVEAAIRRVANVDAAIAMGWPVGPGGVAEAIVAFIDDASADTSELLRSLQTALPRYMLPKEIRVVDSFPLNTSGKIDRGQLRKLLES